MCTHHHDFCHSTDDVTTLKDKVMPSSHGTKASLPPSHTTHGDLPSFATVFITLGVVATVPLATTHQTTRRAVLNRIRSLPTIVIPDVAGVEARPCV
jgi:hypothetical protein